MATVQTDDNNRVQQFSYDDIFDTPIVNPEVFSEELYLTLQDFVMDGSEARLSPLDLQEFNSRKNAEEIAKWQQVLDSTDYAMVQIAERMAGAKTAEEMFEEAQKGAEKYKKKIAAREEAREEIGRLTKGEN